MNFLSFTSLPRKVRTFDKEGKIYTNFIYPFKKFRLFFFLLQFSLLRGVSGEKFPPFPIESMIRVEKVKNVCMKSYRQ